ncbi:MAG: HAD-IC family P-type ATPase, partial [Candidatus Fimimonas sp.]
SCAVEEIAGRGIVAHFASFSVLCGNLQLMKENGIECEKVEGGTVVYVAKNNVFVGAIEIADQLKEDAALAVLQLKQANCKTVLLTGDNEKTAQAVAQKVGVDECHSQLLPQDKAAIVEQMMAQGKKVAFVGDGINDAPVLATADVGIAMGAIGSDAAIEAADVVLMQDNPTAISTAQKISRKTLKIVKQNIVFSIGVKIAVLILSAVGVLDMISFGMIIAVLADVGVCMVAILNSMRAMVLPKNKESLQK